MLSLQAIHSLTTTGPVPREADATLILVVVALTFTDRHNLLIMTREIPFVSGATVATLTASTLSIKHIPRVAPNALEPAPSLWAAEE